MEEDTYQEKQEFKMHGVVDMCFLLDATGSMQPCIDAVRDNIKTFIASVTSEGENGGITLTDWRACVCAYRDYDYETEHAKEWMVMNNFTSDVDELYRQLDNLQAKGGGDEPESLLDALFQVINRGSTGKEETPQEDKWRYPSAAARCIIVMTDAPFHETMSVPGAEGGTVADIRNLMQQERIRLSLFAPEMSCHYDLSMADKCSYDAIEVEESPDPQATQSARVKALAEYTGNQANFQKVMELLAKSVSQSAAADIEEL